jgi:hypothetical protein
MAIYFQLIDINTNDVAGLNQVDDRICTELLQIETHPRFYGGGLYNWYDTIGYKLAEGYTLEDGDKSVTNYYNESTLWEEEKHWLMPIIKFLQTNYKCKSGYTR